MKYLSVILVLLWELISISCVALVVIAAITGDVRLCSGNRCIVDIDRPPLRTE